MFLVLLGCAKPDFRTFSEPVMSTTLMQAELERLHRINLTVGSGDFDPSVYPVSVGVDARNGKMLVEKFICWDDCPDVGMVFLLYERVDTVQACIDAVRAGVGSAHMVDGRLPHVLLLELFTDVGIGTMVLPVGVTLP